jgi:hypothetical protein
MERSRTGIVVAALCACLGSQAAHADVASDGEYTQRLKISQTIDPHGPTPFGEQVNPYTGDLTFSQVDVTLEGNGPTIRLVRNHVSRQLGEAIEQPYSMGDWTLSIPRIETLTHADWHVVVGIDPGRDWFVGTADPDDKYKRCTFFDRPAYHGTLDDPTRGWNGMTLVTENGDQQLVLKRNAALNPSKPSITETSSFPAVTQQFWQIGCLSQTSNAEEGEAFLVVAPDGTKYWLDHLSGVRAETISQQDPTGTGVWLRQGRMQAWMYATRIEDRFGNWVQYHYDGDELDYINASDGRYVDITWTHVGGSSLISDIEVEPGTTPARKWHYGYATSIDPDGTVHATLVDVRLPDQSHWAFQLSNNIGAPISDPMLDRCGYVRDEGDLGNGTPTSSTSTITHPSGLVGTFTVRSTWHGRSYVAGGCVDDINHVSRETNPPLFGTMSLVSKRFSGPGLAMQVWTYDYSSAVGSTIQDPCAPQGSCQSSSWVDVSDPAGNRTRHTYNTHWGSTEGKEIRTDYYQGASTLLRSVSMVYASPSRGPYPSNLGSSMMDGRTNNAKQETLTPIDDVHTAQQGVTFAHDVAATGFDGFARVIDVTDASTLGSRRVQTTYWDNQPRWVLGQVASVTCVAPAACRPTWAPNGIVQSQTTYNAQDLPWKTYAFGKLQSTMTYNADGTLKTATDGNNHATTLSSWYRGVPRLVTHADTTTQSAVVNPYGWVTSVTDEAGALTSYGSDAMGRVNKITYPTGDSTTWTATTITFAPITSAEYGIAANHWRQTTSTGNGRKVTYYDALWRPVLTREYDAGNVAATDRYTAMAYEPGGHVSDSIYPVATAPTMINGTWSLPGIHTAYDALARVTSITQDSELGPLVTTTAYLTGFQTRVTDPRGNATTTRFVAYDQPSYDQPTQIDASEDTRTTILRDPFGKPTAITRGATP